MKPHRGHVAPHERLHRAPHLWMLELQEALPPLAAVEPFELILLISALLACILISMVTNTITRGRAASRAATAEDPAQHAREELVYAKLRNTYIPIYALATFGDWIQGGYLYALYAEYGYSMNQIALIFVVGYGSAATLGTYVGALGDVGGHKRNCIAYGILYACSCLMCNSASFVILSLGRLLGGVAYSILYTSFESWLIAEADASGAPRSMLSRLFALATFCNASSAVIAGIVGHVAVEILTQDARNRFVSAFNVAAAVLALASGLIASRWTERYGDQSVSAVASLAKSCESIRGRYVLFALGLVNSLYEAALYVFVFMWTPSLERRAATVGVHMGHGLVFAIFMLCKMAGSQGFHLLSMSLSPTACLQVVFLGSALCLLVPLVTEDYHLLLVAFCTFEALLGVYWPAIALVRSTELSDAQRSSTMAVFRSLLNVLVIGVLLLVGHLPENLIFGLALAMLLTCAANMSIIQASSAVPDAPTHAEGAQLIATPPRDTDDPDGPTASRFELRPSKEPAYTAIKEIA